MARCAEAGVEISAELAGRLVALLDRVALEPQNLTSVEGVDAGVDRHLADSLVAAALPAIREAGRIVDIGSGGGFPGLPLAWLRPECAVTLVESERRKAAWLMREAVGSPNVRVVGDRTESLARRERELADVVTARAVGPLPVVLELAAPLVRTGGAVVLWRGPGDADEAGGAAAASELGLEHEAAVPVRPFPDAQRVLSVWRKRRATPDRFPRRPGRAAKRPLA